MAKAHFQRGQRVWVEAVGAWALVDHIKPVWAKGFDEPVRITYDVGLGRDFLAHELQAEQRDAAEPSVEAGSWRLLRARNKWQAPEDCIHHPWPGTFPVVVTEPDNDWGGWRVPGAEYDRDPSRVEFQARLIAAAPALMRLAQDLSDSVAEAPEDAPPEMQRLGKTAEAILRAIGEAGAPPDGGSDTQALSKSQAA
jgi:hypothetical protein